MIGDRAMDERFLFVGYLCGDVRKDNMKVGWIWNN